MESSGNFISRFAESWRSREDAYGTYVPHISSEAWGASRGGMPGDDLTAWDAVAGGTQFMRTGYLQISGA